MFRMVPKSMYPLEVPQRPQDFFRPPRPPAPQRKGGAAAQTDAAGAVADRLVGAAGERQLSGVRLRGGAGRAVGAVRLALQRRRSRTWPMRRCSASCTSVRSTRPARARSAHEFAADILAQFGVKSLAGTKIYFVSDRRRRSRRSGRWIRTAPTRSSSRFTSRISMGQAVSPDGTKLAYAVQLKSGWVIQVHSLETGRGCSFFNPPGSLNWTPDFTRTASALLFASNTARRAASRFTSRTPTAAAMDRLTFNGATNVEPKVNPKTGNEIVFVSGRSGMPQIYRMNMERRGRRTADRRRGRSRESGLAPGRAAHRVRLDRGFAPGNYNIFVMDVATRQFKQLTHGAGRNENPAWAPDGRHMVFSSNRDGGQQIWTMLADGTQLRKLTTQGRQSPAGVEMRILLGVHLKVL